MNFSLEDGKKLIHFVRAIINKRSADLKDYSEKSGVFVTIYQYPSHYLRGCMGLPYPQEPLNKAIKEAALLASSSDPRFPPLEKNESYTIEISILTPPEEIKQKDLLNNLDKKIKIGEDGLIIILDHYSGLLLPQVFQEQNKKHKTTPLEALEMVCQKAGLNLNAWKNPKAKVYKFQAVIFEEIEPNGEIIKK